MDQLGYQLVCTFCHAELEVPQNLKKPGEWAYRLMGPFDVQGATISASCSLLIMRLLDKLTGDSMDEHLTAYPGMNIDLNGQKYEIDVLGLVKLTGNREKATPVFAEAKAGPVVEKKDVERLELLARAYPTSVLVFATLRESFDTGSSRLISDMVRRLERSRHRSRGGRVLILGRNELLFKDRLASDMFQNAGLHNGREELRWRRRWHHLCLESQALHLGRDLSDEGLPGRPIRPRRR
jgi:hypothetical protein